MIKVRCDLHKVCGEHECPHWNIHGYSKVGYKKHTCTITHKNVKCVISKW